MVGLPVDSSASSKRYIDYLNNLEDSVWADLTLGVAGTAWPIGTASMPVSNLTDALTIASNRKLRHIRLGPGSWTLPSNVTSLEFSGVGYGVSLSAELDINSKTIDGCVFSRMYLFGTVAQGAAGTFVHINNCGIGFSGSLVLPAVAPNFDVYDSLIDNIALGTSQAWFYNCFGESTTIDATSSTGTKDFVGQKGFLKIQNLSSGDINIWGAGLRVLLPDDNLGGTFWLYGEIQPVDITAGIGSTVHDYVTRARGRTQTFSKAITSAANAGDVTIATITNQTCIIHSIVERSKGATTANLTSAAISGGTGKVVTFIDATQAARANIAAVDQQVAYKGSVTLAATKTIVISLVGTGATAVNLQVDIEYEAVVDDGYLA